MDKTVTVSELKKRALKVPKKVAREFLEELALRQLAPCWTTVCAWVGDTCRGCPLCPKNDSDYCMGEQFRKAHPKTWRKHAKAIANWRLKQKVRKK